MRRMLPCWLALLGACGGAERPPVAPARTTERVEASADPRDLEGPRPEPAIGAAAHEDADPVPAPEPRPTGSPREPVAASRTSSPPALPLGLVPAEHLRPWDLGVVDRGGSALLVGAGRFVVVDRERIVAVHGDGTTPTTEVDNPVGFLRQDEERAGTAVAATEDVLLIHAGRGRYAGFDRRSLARRWEVELGASGLAMSSGDAFAVATDRDLVVLDAASGAERFRRPRVDAHGQNVRAARGIVVVRERNGLVALDAATGATRWTDPRFDSSARLYDPAGDLLPVLANGEVHVLDLDDGSAQGRAPNRDPVPWGRNVLVDGESIYVLVNAAPIGGVALRSYSRDGTLRWTSPRFDSDATGFHPSLVLDDDVVVVCSTRQVAQLVDRATGTVRFTEHPRHGCSMPTTWRPRDGVPNVLFFSSSPASAYARAPEPRTTLRVTVSGVVRCDGAPARGAGVWVGGDRVATNGAGRYRATVSAARELPVHVEQIDRELHSYCSATTRWVDVASTRAVVDFPLGVTYCDDCI